MSALKDKVAVVVGGGTGIGSGIARGLAEAGCKVVVAGRRLEPLEILAGQVESAHKVLCHSADVSDRDSVHSLFEWATTTLGPIDIVCNAAGINIQTRSMATMQPEQWDQMLGINATGAYNVMHAALPPMRERKDGLIINITSVAGKRAIQLGGIAYCASKFAMTALGTATANEVRDEGVRITNVYPGEVNTPLLDQRPNPVSQEHKDSILQPEDFGALMVAIASLPPGLMFQRLFSSQRSKNGTRSRMEMSDQAEEGDDDRDDHDEQSPVEYEYVDAIPDDANCDFIDEAEMGAEDDSAEDDSAEDDSAEDDSAEDDSAEDDSAEDDSAEDDSAEDDSAEDDSAEDDSAEEDSAEDDSAEEDSAEDDSAEEDSAEEDSAEDDSAEDDSAEDDSAEDDSAEDDSAEDDSAEDDSAEDDSAEEDSAEDDSAEEDSAEDDSAEEDSAEEDSAEDDSAEDDSAEDDSAEEDSESGEDETDEFTIDDLGAAYAEAMAEAGLLPDTEPDEVGAGAEASETSEAEHDVAEEPEIQDVAPPTPEGVVEAALFLGHPENKPLSAKELARVMRDVSPNEVKEIIANLNENYEELDHSMRIVAEDGGFRMVLSDEVNSVRRVFYGKVREARLSQPAIELLALVAYQPGISSQELTKQRGKDCAPLLNQLVRRNLLSVERQKMEGQSRPTQVYQPTDRFLNLFGLSSLEDLPQVDEDVESI